MVLRSCCATQDKASEFIWTKRTGTPSEREHLLHPLRGPSTQHNPPKVRNKPRRPFSTLRRKISHSVARRPLPGVPGRFGRPSPRLRRAETSRPWCPPCSAHATRTASVISDPDESCRDVMCFVVTPASSGSVQKRWFATRVGRPSPGASTPPKCRPNGPKILHGEAVVGYRCQVQAGAGLLLCSTRRQPGDDCIADVTNIEMMGASETEQHS